MAAPSQTNEWEFQGEVLSWINGELRSRDVGFERATQEFPNPQGKRSDIVVWREHGARVAALEIELKTPTTPLTDAQFQRDAVRKAQLVGAEYVALWNMRSLVVYRTPAPPRKDLLQTDELRRFPPVESVVHAADWTTSNARVELQQRALDLLLTVYDLDTTGSVGGAVVDATIFVDYLTEQVRKIRYQLHKDFDLALAASKQLRSTIYNWARKQGLAEFVDDLNESLAAQLAYRLVGQTLFYYSFRRQERLPPIELVESRPLQQQLRAFWDAIRVYDYEALYEESPLELVPLRASTEAAVAGLVNQLAGYEWDRIDLDVLGSVFEQLIPEPERIILGQYYTNPRLVDLIVALSVNSPRDVVLDPAVGTGTFLYRVHDRSETTSSIKHQDLLEDLWGLDISAFAAELAVINLCRVDLASRNNFPRVAVRDFFDLKPDEALAFPPARRMPGATDRIRVALPDFDVVIGNPPYVRSQQLDDLDEGYKAKLKNLAYLAGAGLAPKFDAFAYFMVHAHAFLRPGGRLGFVTSAAWMTSAYGSTLQRFILEKFQPIAIVWSEVEPFFSAVEVDTVVVILEKLDVADQKAPRREIRFVRLTKFLQQLIPHPDHADYWPQMDALAIALETAPKGVGEGYSVTLVNGQKELDALRNNPKGLRAWAQFLRMSDIYRDLFG